MNIVTYMVYYWHNDGSIVIIADGLSYRQAVTLCQENYSNGLSCEYDLDDDQGLLERNYRRF